MQNMPRQEDGKGAGSVVEEVVFILYVDIHREGSELVGVFTSSDLAAAYSEKLPALPNGCAYRTKSVETNPAAPEPAVDLAGFYEVTSADSEGYRDFVNEQRVRMSVPVALEIVNDPAESDG